MPTLTYNYNWWDAGYHWSDAGEEWSRYWGSTQLMWTAAILPRVSAFLPAGRIVEIAPGRGRITRYLAGACDELIGIDISPVCVEACRELFPASRFEVCEDGRTLTGVEDGSADLVFSWDSLVHVDAGVMQGYLAEIARVLTPDGAAWLHHSNAAAIRTATVGASKLPAKINRQLARVGVLPDANKARDLSVSGELVAAWAKQHGLKAIAQERISWSSGRWLSDCLTLLVREGSKRDRPEQAWNNPAFAADATRIARLAAFH